MAQVSTLNEHQHSEVQPLLSERPLTSEVDHPVSHENDSDTKDPKTSRRVFLKISFLLFGDVLGNSDEYFLLAVYEKIASEFQSSESAAWIILAESLMFMISLPTYGFLSDRYGSKIPVLGSYVTLIIGALVTSAAGNFWIVVGGRMISGIAVAGMLTMTSIVIVAHAKPSDVGVLRSYALIFTALGRNSGPTVGGLLTSAVGWRGAFLCEIPFVVVCCIVVGMFFDPGTGGKETSDSEGQLRTGPATSAETRKEPIDIAGMVLFDIAMAAFVIALKHVGDNSDTAKVILGCSTAAFGIFIIALVLRERSVGKRAFVPLHVFRSKLGLHFFLQFCWLFVILSVLSILPVFFARVTNATAAENALHILPLTICGMLGNLVAARLIKISNRYKPLMHIAMLIATVGLLLMGLRWNGPINIGESLYVGITGFGGGMFQASSFIAVSTAIEDKQKGSMIGFFFLAAEIGGFIGMSTSSTIVNLVLKQQLMEKGPDVPHRAEIIKGILQDSSFAFSLPEVWQKLAVSAFADGFQRLFLGLTAVSVVIQSLILVIKEEPIEQ